jgi:phosphoadenosine phosphosulfate reductase
VGLLTGFLARAAVELTRLARGTQQSDAEEDLQMAAPHAAPHAASVEDAAGDVRSGKLESLSARALLEWGMDRFAPHIALSASFGSPEGMVILHLMHDIDPKRTRVFTVDPGRLPQQTYDLMDRVRDRYGIPIEVYVPDSKRVEAMVRAQGMNLFYESVEKRQMCCGIRKVEPLERALAGLRAWIAGLRADQSVTRGGARSAEIDTVHGGIIKLNPLVRWTRAEVLDYVNEHHIPIHSLHAQGYPSVGCAPCSRAISAGEDERAGRWWWESPELRECGIHTGYEASGSGI